MNIYIFFDYKNMYNLIKKYEYQRKNISDFIF